MVSVFFSLCSTLSVLYLLEKNKKQPILFNFLVSLLETLESLL